jgi:hypothetical protein
VYLSPEQQAVAAMLRGESDAVCSVSSRGKDLLGFLGKLAIQKIADGEDRDIRIFF